MADDLKNVVAQVKLAYNIVDYIVGSGVKLKRSGSTFVGLCVFHQDSHPSMRVSEHFQNYKCFACGASGDLIRFVQETENLEFFDALKKLAEDKGIAINFKEEKSGVDYSSLREAMKAVSNFYYHEYKKLDMEHPARRQVLDRQLSEKKIGYGYAPEGRRKLYEFLKEKGFSDDTILHTGACVKFENNNDIVDFWRGRLMFFITDITGKPIGWSGRKLYENDQRGKYVNSKDGVLFDKSSSLYHLSAAKKQSGVEKTVYVAEGQFDVAALTEAGMVNSVASSGTAFTDKQGQILRRLVTEDGKIVFCFDGDKAGRDAVEKVFKNIPLIHGQAFVVSFPEGLDPCDFRLKHGNDGLRDFVENSRIPIVEFVLDQTALDYDLSKDLSRGQYVEAAAKILKTLNNQVLREVYTKKVSLDSFTSIEIVREAVDKAKPFESRSANTLKATNEILVPQASQFEPIVVKLSDENSDDPLTGSEPRVSFAEVVENYSNFKHWEIPVRMLVLALREVSLVERFPDDVNFPKPLQEFLVELSGLPSGDKIIAEMFTETELAEWMMDSAKFFPFVHLMNDDSFEQQFDYLVGEWKNLKYTSRVHKVRMKIADKLLKSPGQGAKFFEKAIEVEKHQIEEFS